MVNESRLIQFFIHESRFWQKANWTRFVKLSKSYVLCALHLTGVASVLTITDQKPTNLKYKGKPANIEDFRV